MIYEIKQEAVRSGQSINRGEEIEQDHGNQFKPSKQMTVKLSLSLSLSKLKFFNKNPASASAGRPTRF
jgi:hypothetical protein